MAKLRDIHPIPKVSEKFMSQLKVCIEYTDNTRLRLVSISQDISKDLNTVFRDWYVQLTASHCI